ncbi:MAG: endonuclease MutS2, partial [Crocinitomicaceae bacterium]
AFSEKTIDRILKTRPKKDFDTIHEALSQIEELKNIHLSTNGFPRLEFDDLHKEIKLLGIKRSIIPLSGVLKIYGASQLVNAYLKFFEFHNEKFQSIESVFSDTYKTNEIIDAVEKIIDSSGAIKDSASSNLKSIRTSIKGTHRKIQRNFEKELRRLSKSNLLSDTKETVIGSRRVLSVKAAYKKQFSGTLMGTSKTGSMVHIEPSVNAELNNLMDQLRIEEENEIQKILRELTEFIASFKWLIEGYNKSLHNLDFINAKYKLSKDMDACMPKLTKKKEIIVKKAVHPLLRKKNNQEKKPTYGQDIILNEAQRIIVISGPNAGGKSITLKTLGLLQMMVQSGFFVSADWENSFYVFDRILSEIGDNQSIENELSTYSYRLQRMKKFLSTCNNKTLLLLDEFGTGSDPDLGGALAESFFESFYEKEVFTALTTHYNNIKSKAMELPNAINGCMLFNPDDLRPLFEFQMGSPGSSFTFEVAKNNGIPTKLIKNAKQKLDKEKLKFNELLADLQRKTNRLEQEIQRNKKESKYHSNKAEEIDAHRSKLTQKYEKINRTMQVQEAELLAGKKMLEFLSKFKTSRGKKNNEDLMKEVLEYFKAQKTKKEAKKKANKPKRKLSQKQVKSYQQEKIVVGSQVKIIATRQLATVEEIKGNNTVLSVGNNRIKVGLKQLIWIK